MAAAVGESGDTILGCHPADLNMYHIAVECVFAIQYIYIIYYTWILDICRCCTTEVV